MCTVNSSVLSNAVFTTTGVYSEQQCCSLSNAVFTTTTGVYSERQCCSLSNAVFLTSSADPQFQRGTLQWGAKYKDGNFFGDFRLKSPSVSATVGALLTLLTLTRNIVNKVPELQQLLYYENYDILFVAETWLRKNISSGILDPNKHYNVLRKDRTNSTGAALHHL